jgi:hypothetical protein
MHLQKFYVLKKMGFHVENSHIAKTVALEIAIPPIATCAKDY